MAATKSRRSLIGWMNSQRELDNELPSLPLRDVLISIGLRAVGVSDG